MAQAQARIESSPREIVSHHDTRLALRLEAPSTLLRHGISCAIWGEDALQQYGVRTVSFDLFLLVENPEAASRCLEGAGYSRAPSNPRYKFIPELYVLPRFKKMPFDDVDDQGAVCVAILQAQRCRYNLPPASAIKDPVPSLPTLIDSIIDAWLDATTTDYAMHLAVHLSYLHHYCPEARDPLLANELKPEHRDFYHRFLSHPAIQAERQKWKEVRDSLLVAT